MINRYDTFTSLKEVVLGQVNMSLVNLIKDERERDFLQAVLEQTSDSLNQIEKIYKDEGIKVHRPMMVEYDPNVEYNMPTFSLKAVSNPLAAADNFLTIADAVIEMSSVSEHNYFDYVQYQHIWRDQFKEGSRWLSMPRPTYNPLDIDHYTWRQGGEPLADAPAFLPCGQHIFHQEILSPDDVSAVVTDTALKWMQREFPQFEYIPMAKTKGHLDGYVHIVKPGLILSAFPKSELHPIFKSWEVCELESENYNDVKLFTEFMQDDDYENTTLAVNCFNINENKVMMLKHVMDRHPETMRIMEKANVDLVPIEYDMVRWVNQSIGCVNNAIHREGGRENYF